MERVSFPVCPACLSEGGPLAPRVDRLPLAERVDYLRAPLARGRNVVIGTPFRQAEWGVDKPARPLVLSNGQGLTRSYAACRRGERSGGAVQRLPQRISAKPRPLRGGARR